MAPPLGELAAERPTERVTRLDEASARPLSPSPAFACGKIHLSHRERQEICDFYSSSLFSSSGIKGLNMGSTKSVAMRLASAGMKNSGAINRMLSRAVMP